MEGYQSVDEDDETDDDYSEDEYIESPIDEVDPFIYFVETVEGKHLLFLFSDFVILHFEHT